MKPNLSLNHCLPRPLQRCFPQVRWPLFSRPVLALLACAALVGGSAGLQPAQAAQTLELREGDTTIARVSIRDQTRLRVERGRVLDVIGDVFDAEKNPAGRVVVLKDEGEGEVYVKPVPPVSMRGMDGGLLPGPMAGVVPPVKLDIKTDRGTVGLVLQPADVIGDTLTLRITGYELRAPSIAPIPKATSHVRGAKALTLAMASPGLAGEVPMQRMPGRGLELTLWKEARFFLVKRFDVPGLVGEVYELTNISSQPMVIDERELYRPGVLTIGLRDLQLAPGATTLVWIVRQADAND